MRKPYIGTDYEEGEWIRKVEVGIKNQKEIAEAYETMYDLLDTILFSLKEGSVHCSVCGGKVVMLKDIDIKGIQEGLIKAGGTVE